MGRKSRKLEKPNRKLRWDKIGRRIPAWNFNGSKPQPKIPSFPSFCPKNPTKSRRKKIHKTLKFSYFFLSFPLPKKPQNPGGKIKNKIPLLRKTTPNPPKNFLSFFPKKPQTRDLNFLKNQIFRGNPPKNSRNSGFSIKSEQLGRETSGKSNSSGGSGPPGCGRNPG